MNLSEYLNIIYPYLADSKSTYDFIIDYFDWCIEEDTADEINNPFVSLTKDYVNRIFNGSKKISKSAANEILRLSNRERHDEYFEDNSSVDALESLEDDLARKIEIDKTKHTSEICFNILTTILAATSRDEEPNFNLGRIQRIDIRNIKDLEVSLVDGKIAFKNTQLPSGELDPVPEEFSEQELTYITALFEAYTDEYQSSINKYNINDSLEKYRRNLSDQRENFYSAESVNRFVRDGVLEGDNYFTELLDETYDGITDTVWADYDNGYKRLSETLKHVSTISLNGAALAHVPRLINNKVRKGICHILVNNNRIVWVNKDE